MSKTLETIRYITTYLLPICARYTKSQTHSLSSTEILLHLFNLNKLVLKAYKKDPRSHDGWEMLHDSSVISIPSGFYGQVWIHRERKEMVFASAGTKIDIFSRMNCLWTAVETAANLIKDIINDIQIYLHLPPFQYKFGMEPFIDHTMSVCRRISIELDDYKIFFTGHSLYSSTKERASEICYSLGFTLLYDHAINMLGLLQEEDTEITPT